MRRNDCAQCFPDSTAPGSPCPSPYAHLRNVTISPPECFRLFLGCSCIKVRQTQSSPSIALQRWPRFRTHQWAPSGWVQQASLTGYLPPCLPSWSRPSTYRFTGASLAPSLCVCRRKSEAAVVVVIVEESTSMKNPAPPTCSASGELTRVPFVPAVQHSNG